MSQYIPYSIRNNIKDPELAGLLDYLEREMGGEIQIDKKYAYGIAILNKGKEDGIFLGRIDSEIGIKVNGHCTRHFFATTYIELKTPLLFANYKTLFPNIRDLYSK